jgi:hypothetical protein
MVCPRLCRCRSVRSAVMTMVLQAYRFALDPTVAQEVVLRSHCKGPKIRFPRFKGKRAGLSCRFTTGSLGLTDGDRRHVKLPPASALYGPTSRPANSLGMLSASPPGSAPPPSAIKAGGGSARSPSRSTATTPPLPDRTRSSGSISGSSRRRCFLPAKSSRTPGISTSRCGSYGGCSGRPPAGAARTGAPGRPRRRGGARLSSGSGGCISRWPTPGVMGCTRCPLAWSAPTV